MKKFYITIIMTILPILAFSQGENDNWYFGNYAGVNFSNPSPTALTNSQMYTEEASGAVSDSNGNLLFYTNGETIWTREHQPMQNGTGLTGHTYSTQQLAIAKNPANPKQYYVFTAALTEPTSSFIAYSIVDMTQGNIVNGQPLGKVLTNYKNIPIVDQNGNQFQTEAITLVMHSDGVSFWVLVPNGNNLYSYRVTAAGFNPIPVVSSVNMLSELIPTSYFGIRASPKIDSGSGFTNYISISLWRPAPNASYFYRNKVMSFNDTTGQITSHYSIDFYTEKSYISEFNKDGKILYLGQNRIYAVDLSASSSSVVYNLIYNGYNTGKSFWGIQRNSKNEIYISSPLYGYLSKITNPDTYGGSGLNLDEIYLQGKTTYLGLPQQLLITNANTPECFPNKILQNAETNVDYIHAVSDYIITLDNYSTDASNNSITLQANNYVLLKPNTSIKFGSDFLAKIEPCNNSKNQERKDIITPTEQKRVSLTLDLREKIGDDNSIKIYPNPTSDILYIKSNSKINRVEVFDISGKKIITILNDNKIDVKNFPAGSYIINIETKEGKITEKFIKK